MVEHAFEVREVTFAYRSTDPNKAEPDLRFGPPCEVLDRGWTDDGQTYTMIVRMPVGLMADGAYDMNVLRAGRALEEALVR